MRRNISSMVFAGLLMAGVTGSALAEDHIVKPDNYNTINMLFSNDTGDSINYSFSSYVPTGSTEWFNDFDSATYDIGGVTRVYNSTDYGLILDYSGNSYFAIFDYTASYVDPISKISFDGEIYIQNELVAAIVYGTGNEYLASDFIIDNGAAVLRGSPDGLPDMTRLEVTTVSAVPVPAAVWLFGSGLIGLVGIARRRA